MDDWPSVCLFVLLYVCLYVWWWSFVLFIVYVTLCGSAVPYFKSAKKFTPKKSLSNSQRNPKRDQLLLLPCNDWSHSHPLACVCVPFWATCINWNTAVYGRLCVSFVTVTADWLGLSFVFSPFFCYSRFWILLCQEMAKTRAYHIN